MVRRGPRALLPGRPHSQAIRRIRSAHSARDDGIGGTQGGRTSEIEGSITITFEDWNIPNPSIGGVVTTEDNGTLEFLLTFTHA